MYKSRFVLITLIVILALGSLSACSSQTPDVENLAMLPLQQMPARVQTAAVSVQQAYQFNAANPDLMTQIPCYCGCGGIGHASNYDCYVANVDAEGVITYDNHALGCSICVDITLDAMRMAADGQSAQAIREAIDATYAKYGPSNIPQQ